MIGQTAERRGHFKVKVDCWYEDVSNNRRSAVRKRLQREVIVEGNGPDEAIQAALEWAERTFPFGPKLVGVEHRECFGPVQFPVELIRTSSKTQADD